MGERGPLKKPTKLKLLQGNPGGKKLPENEPEYAKLKNTPEPPDYLSAAGVRIWEDNVKAVFNADLLTEGDLEAFASLCNIGGQWWDIQDMINSEDSQAVIFTDKGYPIKNPLYTQSAELFKQYVLLMKHFGMTPSARADMGVSIDKKEESTWAKTMG